MKGDFLISLKVVLRLIKNRKPSGWSEGFLQKRGTIRRRKGKEACGLAASPELSNKDFVL